MSLHKHEYSELLTIFHVKIVHFSLPFCWQFSSFYAVKCLLTADNIVNIIYDPVESRCLLKAFFLLFYLIPLVILPFLLKLIWIANINEKKNESKITKQKSLQDSFSLRNVAFFSLHEKRTKNNKKLNRTKVYSKNVNWLMNGYFYVT